MSEGRVFWCSAWMVTLGITIVSPPVGLVTGLVVIACQWLTGRRAR